MKKIVARIVLIAYISLLLRPFLPFVMDFLAHTFWYTQHMATVHYENGKFHVHYEYLEAARKSAPEKNDHSIRAMVDIGDHLTRTISYTFTLPPLKTITKGFYNFSLPVVFPGGIDPPPKA
jgi:hypothetical protein